ncbi:MAG TPA: formyltransferase family protein [Stellaceae bacterium]|nr:formyltransferase family protein [Stellaceae bacterium]
MGILMIMGSTPRHVYMARAVAASGRLEGIIVETRGWRRTGAPAGAPPRTLALFERHYAERAAAEVGFFGSESDARLPGVEAATIPREEMNGPRCWAIIDRMKPDLLLTYGIGKLTQETLAHARGHRWNIHGGLVPFYRGGGPHFWPSYLLEPQMTGVTMHDLTDAIDGGAVVHQSVGALVRGDGINEFSCRTTAGFAAELPEVLIRAFDGRLKPPQPQKTTGRLWRSVDFRPQHLHAIYDVYQNRIVDRYLDGEFPGREPRTVRQF